MDTLGRALVTLGALTIVILRLGLLASQIDAVNAVLLVIAVVPWFTPAAERFGLGARWRERFERLESEQEQQKEQLARLRSLSTFFLTEHEIDYLRKLGRGESFRAEANNVPPYFGEEMNRLVYFGMVEALPEKGVQTLVDSQGELAQHFRLTDRGREYVRLHDELHAQPPGAAASAPAGDVAWRRD